MKRLLAAMIGVGVAPLTGLTAQSASSAAGRTVPCGDAIASTKFPYLGSNRPEYRYRQVLGVIAVPPAYMKQVVPTGEQPWAYWHKQGLVIRATRQSVTVTVPKESRKRAAITWGNSGGPVSSLRIEGCKATSANVGYAFAGGFLLRSPSACIPLTFRVGRRSATVRFGLGQRCHT
jgi:hypothetical protein